jgi:hypothetical protein
MKIEVFRSGVWKGIPFPPERVKRIAATYNRNYPVIEAPAVIGHPDELDPTTEAYGWVRKLEFAERNDPKTGQTFTSLYAHFDQFVPEFLNAVKAGRWKQRSIKLRGDQMTHVGFLGGMLPAVKGLDPIPVDAFADGDADDDGETFTQEFAELTAASSTKQTDAMTVEEIQKAISDGIAAATKPLRTEINSLKKQLKASESDDGDDGEAKPRGKAKEFAEEPAKPEDSKEFKELQTQNAKLQDQVLEAQFSEYLQSEKLQTRVLPAQRPQVLATMKRLAADATEIEFSEGSGKDAKVTKSKPLDVYKSFLEGLPEQVEFSELATEDNANGGDDDEAGSSTFSERSGRGRAKEAGYITAAKGIVAAHPNAKVATK